MCAFAHVFSEKCAFLCAKGAKNLIFAYFECFFWYELERSRYLPKQLQKRREGSSKSLELCYIMYCRPEKPLESFFGRILYEKTPVFGEIGKKLPGNAKGRLLHWNVIASFVLLLVRGTLHSTINMIERSL